MSNTYSPEWLHAARDEAISLFDAGVKAADPALAVAQALRASNDQLELLPLAGSESLPASGKDWTCVHVIALGKAACATAEAAQAIIPRRLRGGRKGIAVTNAENAVATSNTDVFAAGHPLPNAAGLEAARLVADRVKGAQAGELVLVLISGGGSALLPYPPESIPLADKIATTELLLASGASIDEINAVRKHLSLLKGGQLAALAAPAALHALILSDVIGDDLSSIASGPTVPDASTYADALHVLESRKVWNRLPDSVRHHISQGYDGAVSETPKPDDPLFADVSHALIGSNRMSLDAVADQARAKGARRTTILSDALCGEARDAAGALVAAAKKAFNRATGESLAILAGGETTVTLKGNGLGGRNQEMALAFALAAEEQQLPECWAFLSGGTDGRDGPTDAAGGLVDPGTLARIRERGLDPSALLENNDSNRALSAAGDLLLTGATGTNVADLQILLIN